jgi:hypothetical protein
MNEAEATGATTQETSAAQVASGSEARGWLLGTLGWLVPGLGHLVQKKYDRAVVFFVSVMSMGVLGLLMGGKLYAPPFERGQSLFVMLLHLLGFLGDLGAGLLFVLAAGMGMGRDYMDRALGDYGTVFFLCAGLLNVLTALDAYDIAVGRKG